MALEDLAGYSLRRRLGSGSAGTLWQVRDLATGRNAALKRIPVTAIQRKEQFRDELMVLQRVHHPHVARVLEVRETPSEWLVFSQYVVALSLTTVLSRRGSLSPGEIVTLLSPLADALHYLHRCGLIHGHLTPSNVLIDVEGRPILTDTALHSLNIRPLEGAPAEPPSTTNDRQALATLALHAGGPAALFPPAVFTDTPSNHLAAHLLTLTTPEPILVGDPDDLAPDLHASAPLPSDDDAIEASRGPLSAPQPKPPTQPALQATTPEPPTPKPLQGRPKSPRRLRLPKLTRRTPAPAPVPSPLSRLTAMPLTKTHVILPTETHLIGTTHIEPAISWSTPSTANRPDPSAPPSSPESTPRPRAPLADRRDPATPSFVLPVLQTPTPEPAPDRPGAPMADAYGPDAAPFTFAASPTRSPESALSRTRTRRRPWRRHHTWWGRLRATLRGWTLEANGSLVDRVRGFFARPIYGVAGAVGLGLAVLLALALVARLVLDPSDAAVAASEQTPALPATPSRSPSADLTTSANPPGPHRTGPTRPPTSRRTDPAVPPTPRRTGSGRSVAEWLRTLRALDVQRAQAFRTLDVALLDKIYLPGSAPWRSDRGLLADYRSRGVRIHGLQIQIDRTAITRQTPTTVTLRTTDHLAAGRAIDKTGTSTRLPPGVPTTRLITLTKTVPVPITSTSTWRITTITPP